MGSSDQFEGWNASRAGFPGPQGNPACARFSTSRRRHVSRSMLGIVTLLLALAPSARSDAQPRQQQAQPPEQQQQSGGNDANGTNVSRAPSRSRVELLESLRDEKQRLYEPAEEEGTIKENFVDPIMSLAESEVKPVLGGEDHSGQGIVVGVEWYEGAVGRHWEEEAQPNRVDLGMRLAGSNYAYADALVEGSVLNIAGLPFNLKVEGAYNRYPREPFFGIGQGSLKENRTTYLFKSTRAGASLWWDLPSGFRIGSGVDIIGMSQEPGNGPDDPSTVEVFTAEQLPGLGAKPTFVRFGGFADFDWRDRPKNPRHGGYYALRIYDYNDQNENPPAFEFRSYEVEMQQFIGFLNRHRIIALRFLGQFTDADEPDRVPFFLWPTLGGSTDLRGFRTFRFRDFNKMLLQAEYRWVAAMGLEMALFFDAGKVFPHRGEFNLDNLETAYGVGLRFATDESLFFRLDFAYSGEGFKPHFSLNRIF